MLKRIIGLAALATVLALPAPVRAQGPASVCVDGTTSNATGSGACSGHGGVDKAKTAAAHTPPAPPPAPATMVNCKDGTQSKSGKGACSHHGGVGAATPTMAAQPPAPAPHPAPAPPSAPAVVSGTPVMCTDGTTFNSSGKGACSHHGGVKHTGTAPALPPAAPPAAPAGAPALAGNGDSPNNNPQGAIAKCKDGTFSHAKQHSGACSKHGGVGQWLDGTTKTQ